MAVPDEILWPRANATAREQYLEAFKREGIDKIELDFFRENREGLFFSQDAMEDMCDKFVAMVAAKLMREYETHGKPPHTLRVKVDLETEV